MHKRASPNGPGGGLCIDPHIILEMRAPASFPTAWRCLRFVRGRLPSQTLILLPQFGRKIAAKVLRLKHRANLGPLFGTLVWESYAAICPGTHVSSTHTSNETPRNRHRRLASTPLFEATPHTSFVYGPFNGERNFRSLLRESPLYREYCIDRGTYLTTDLPRFITSFTASGPASSHSCPRRAKCASTGARLVSCPISLSSVLSRFCWTQSAPHHLTLGQPPRHPDLFPVSPTGSYRKARFPTRSSLAPRRCP